MTKDSKLTDSKPAATPAAKPAAAAPAAPAAPVAPLAPSSSTVSGSVTVANAQTKPVATTFDTSDSDEVVIEVAEIEPTVVDAACAAVRVHQRSCTCRGEGRKPFKYHS